MIVVYDFDLFAILYLQKEVYMGIKIIGTGMYVPDIIVTNDDLATIVDTSDEWITQRTGIKTRHLTNGELTFQMGAKAAKEAIENAGIMPEDIDMILGTTMTPDCFMPSMACLVGHELNINNAVCMDLNAACTGYIYALDTARSFLETGNYKNILIVSSEVMSRTIDFNDRATCVLFGDGAGATVVTKSEGLYASNLGGNPTGALKLYAKLPAPNHPFKKGDSDWGNPDVNAYIDEAIRMEGDEVYKFATTVMPKAVKNVVEKAGISLEQLDMLIPHQANVRILLSSNKRLKMPFEKIYVGIEEYGNISSACIPLAMHKLSKENKLKSGDKICIVGFGAGLTYGSVVFEW